MLGFSCRFWEMSGSLGQMLLVTSSREEGARQDPVPLEKWTSLFLAGWVARWARKFANFFCRCVLDQRSTVCSQERVLCEICRCCLSGTHVLHYSPSPRFCRWLRSTSGFLRFLSVLAELFKAVIAPSLEVRECSKFVCLVSACFYFSPRAGRGGWRHPQDLARRSSTVSAL